MLHKINPLLNWLTEFITLKNIKELNEIRAVIFGSKKHVELLLHASKVITAFIENNNVFPFPKKEVNAP